jgi:putative tryptophan/tyrosine transport system substrate-binding protein
MRLTVARLATLALLLLAAPLAAEAQPPPRIPRIGFLSESRQPWDEGFRQGLSERGYVLGQNIVIEYRYADGKLERLPGLASELVRLNVDVIVAGGTHAIGAAKHATRVIPIVMAVTADPVGSGFVASLGRPGGNITGLTSLSTELSGKRLALLKEMLPTLSRVIVLWNSGNPDNAGQLREAEAAAQALGVHLQPIGVRDAQEVDKAFSVILGSRADTVYMLGDALISDNRARIADFMTRHRLPSMFTTRQSVEAGGLVAYGTSFVDLFRRAALYVDKILKGAKPGDLPVEQPRKFDLVINMRTAKTLGLAIPQPVLLRADEVIQ